MISFKSLKNQIPLPIRLFLGKAFLLFVIWKLTYNFFLYDSQYLDVPLTTHVSEASANFLNSFSTMDGFTAKREVSSYIYEGGTVKNEASVIYHYDKIVLYIANVCNGLELMVLYAGFIMCMPSSFWRKVKYIIIGVILLDVINIVRCTGLIYLREYFHIYFDFAHHYLFNAIVYSATLLMWVVFTRKIHLKNETVQIR